MNRKLMLSAIAVCLGLSLTAIAQQAKSSSAHVNYSGGYQQPEYILNGQNTRYTPGDVFVAIGINGLEQEYTPAGQLVQTLNDLTGSSITTGMAFDTHGSLYVTNFAIGTVSEFDINGNVVNPNFITGHVSPESLSAPGGQFPMLLGDADYRDQNNKGVIYKYDSNGTLLDSYDVDIERRGTDWVDLQPDGHTVLYTSEGISILSYDIATRTQNPLFATGLPGSNAFAHRTLSSGPFAGDDLVADSEVAVLVAPGGNIVRTYELPGNGGADFALNLDQGGTAFWTGDLASGLVWEVDIATGTILQQWQSPLSETNGGGLAVFQERGQGVGPCARPDIPACQGH